MSVELLKDAEDKTIPLSTKALYDKDGEGLNIRRFEFNPISGEWSIVALKGGPYDWTDVYRSPQDVYLEKPIPHDSDSWEKLEEDLDRGIKGARACAYICKDGVCQNCVVREDQSFDYPSMILKNVKRRIHNLRSEN